MAVRLTTKVARLCLRQPGAASVVERLVDQLLSGSHDPAAQARGLFDPIAAP